MGADLLQDMKLEIKHRSGKENSNADALFRYPIDVYVRTYRARYYHRIEWSCSNP